MNNKKDFWAVSKHGRNFVSADDEMYESLVKEYQLLGFKIEYIWKSLVKINKMLNVRSEGNVM